MIEIKKDYDITKLNTFGINAKAKFFVEIENEEDLKELFLSEEFSAKGGSANGGKNNEHLFLGGGSNILFTKDFDGIIVRSKLKGIEIVKESSFAKATQDKDENNVYIRAMGGEWWNDLVLYTVEKNYWGIENLSLIYGTVGGAPVQNIGAYGVELKDILENVEAYEIATGEKRIFTKEECEFGYRDSIFKNKLKGQYFITAITLKLSKVQNKNTSYKALEDYLEKNKKEIKTSEDVALAIADIRQSKLPDPKVLGNSGSFFKNVYVDFSKLEELKKSYPDIPCFEEKTSPLAPLLNKERGSPINIGRGEVNAVIKIPAGWLIEQCGPTSGTSWKGYRVGNVGVHEKQALVLVNYGGATGAEVLDLANKIIDSVYEKFGLKLSPEVNLI